MSEDDSAFLMDLTEALHSVAMPNDEIEERVAVVARRCGLEANLLVLQSALFADVNQDGVHRYAFRRIPFDTHWRLFRARRLVRLVDDLVDARYGLEVARVRLESIMSAPSPYSQGLVSLGYAAYGLAVAARVGGGVREILAAAVVGIVAGIIHFGTTSSDELNLEKSFLAGFGGGLTVVVLASFVPELDVGRALFGGVSLLVPAMVITIATHELARGSLEAGSARLIYGCLRFLMLGAGTVAAVKSWSVLVHPVGSDVMATALPHSAIFPILGIGALALVVILQVPLREAGWVLLAVLVAYGTQELTKIWAGGRGAPFVSAFVLGAVAQMYGRTGRHAAATMIVPGLLQLAPGFLGTAAIIHLLRGEYSPDENFFRLFLVAMQLVMGLLAAQALFARHHRNGRNEPMSRLNPRRLPVAASILLAVLAVGACSSTTTTVEQTWTDPTASRTSLRKVAMIYVSRDGAARRNAEDEMARHIQGVEATPAYTVLSDADTKDSATAQRKLKAAGFDGVVTMRMVGKEQTIDAAPVAPYPAFGVYWGAAWPAAYDPAYLDTDTIVRMETNAYSLDSDKLVWSGLSRTFDPSSARQLVNEVTKSAAKQMSHVGLVPPQEKS